MKKECFMINESNKVIEDVFRLRRRRFFQFTFVVKYHVVTLLPVIQSLLLLNRKKCDGRKIWHIKANIL